MNNKNYKLVAFDVDGTILINQCDVCPELIRIVAELKQKGYIFTIASARFPISALNIAAKLGIGKEDIITLNGGFITNNEHSVIYNKTFALDDNIKKLFANISSEISICYYAQFDWISTIKNSYTEAERRLVGIDYDPYTKQTIPSQLNKVTLLGDQADLQHVQKQLHTIKDLTAAFSHTSYLEVMHSSISKFDGLMKLAKARSINVEQIIAFGDGENDIPMLQGVGLGVAMANASEQVKDAAKAVAGYNYSAGVATYLKKLISQRIL